MVIVKLQKQYTTEVEKRSVKEAMGSLFLLLDTFRDRGRDFVRLHSKSGMTFSSRLWFHSKPSLPVLESSTGKHTKS